MHRCRLRIRRRTGTRSRCSVSTSAPLLLTVTTSDVLEVSTGWNTAGDVPGHIPLAMNDVYVLHEQLPYAYFFRETLPEASLAASLELVLAAFPVLGGRLCLDSRTIALSEEDVVHLSIGHTDVPLENWMRADHGVYPKTGRPHLLQLFDPLPEHPWDSRTPLARIRITYMADGGTCIGINISHAAADAASCIRFVCCWGRQHRGLPYSIPVNNRAEVTVNGMLTAEKAEIMNLKDAGTRTGENGIIAQIFGFWAGVLGLQQTTPIRKRNVTTPPHGYLTLPFSLEVLHAMKSYGAHECVRVMADGGDSQEVGDGVTFVSTNDMITSTGWMIMRQLSGNLDWSMNIVVNIRGRGGTDNFGAGRGLFGNGITAATASIPTAPNPSSTIDLRTVAAGARAARRALMSCYDNLPDKLAASQRGVPKLLPAIGPAFCTTSWHFPVFDLAFADGGNKSMCQNRGDDAECLGDIGASNITGYGAAAWAEAIEAHVPSGCVCEEDGKHGRPIAFHGQFAKNRSFLSTERVSTVALHGVNLNCSFAFHHTGQIVHPLPPGETYAAIVVPTAGNGLEYQLFLPVAKMAKARQIHELLCTEFLSSLEIVDGEQ